MKEPVELYVDGYAPAKAPPALRREVSSAIAALRNLCKALRLHRPRIHYTDDLAGCACYCSGSQDWPVIVISPGPFADPDIDLRRGVESTLAHELMHAYLETLGLDCCDYEHPEDEIEDLARRYCDGLLPADEVAADLDKLTDSLM
jgi:hypothetical protein